MEAAIIVHGGAGAWNLESEPVAQGVDDCTSSDQVTGTSESASHGSISDFGKALM